MYMSLALFLGPRSFYIIIESVEARCISSDILRLKNSENRRVERGRGGGEEQEEEGDKGEK